MVLFNQKKIRFYHGSMPWSKHAYGNWTIVRMLQKEIIYYYSSNSSLMWEIKLVVRLKYYQFCKSLRLEIHKFSNKFWLLTELFHLVI